MIVIVFLFVLMLCYEVEKNFKENKKDIEEVVKELKEIKNILKEKK